jgi:hypothetical protein
MRCRRKSHLSLECVHQLHLTPAQSRAWQECALHPAMELQLHVHTSERDYCAFTNRNWALAADVATHVSQADRPGGRPLDLPTIILSTLKRGRVGSPF